MTDKHVKTAIITGAGTGIGRAIAVAFCDAGMNCVLAGRRADVLEETAASARNSLTETHCVPADVTCRDSVKALSDRTVERFGRIDILVNNAGINTLQRGLRDISDEDWDRVVDINLTGAFNAFRAVMPQMENQGDGLVINISSMAGKRSGMIAGVAYCASKFGMAALNQSINAEFRETGIRACCIFPGEVDTPILDLRPNPVSDEKRAAALPPEDIAAAALMVAQLPGRAIVEEITIFPRRVVAK
ncbi:MAG: SDR family oxidoreductase [Candidatus Latescibacteria bacterium]|nr:SDR family oxidoreductase [Candidatus Latescibacterota bacterium]